MKKKVKYSIKNVLSVPNLAFIYLPILKNVISFQKRAERNPPSPHNRIDHYRGIFYCVFPKNVLDTVNVRLPDVIRIICHRVFARRDCIICPKQCVSFAQSSEWNMTLQCDAIRWEQLENLHFWRGFNFWTNDLILILKTPTGPYSCRANVIFCSELV